MTDLLSLLFPRETDAAASSKTRIMVMGCSTLTKGPIAREMFLNLGAKSFAE
jgi:hypothetical protein